MHKTRSAKANAYPAHSLPTECFCEPGLFTASGEMEPRQPPACTQLFQETARGSGDRKRLRRPQAAQETASGSGDRELAFLGNPFEGFGRAFDPILAIVTVGRKQADHLIVATGG